MSVNYLKSQSELFFHVTDVLQYTLILALVLIIELNAFRMTLFERDSNQE